MKVINLLINWYLLIVKGDTGKSQIIHADNLVDPPYERRHLNVHSRHVHASTSEAPGHQTRQFEEAVVLAHQWTSSVTLTSVVALFAAGTETRGRQNEDLLRYRIHFSDTLCVADDRNLGLAYPQGNRSSCEFAFN